LIGSGSDLVTDVVSSPPASAIGKEYSYSLFGGHGNHMLTAAEEGFQNLLSQPLRELKSSLALLQLIAVVAHTSAGQSIADGD